MANFWIYRSTWWTVDRETGEIRDTFYRDTLPELPDVDASVYPYKIILGRGEYYLYFLSKPVMRKNIDGVDRLCFDANSVFRRFSCSPNDDRDPTDAVWVEGGAPDIDDNSVWVYWTNPNIQWVWSNHEIRDYEDGSVVYEPYDPIRAYTKEEVTITPSAIMLNRGESRTIAFTLTLADGTVLDNSLYDWSGTDGNNSGTLTITEADASSNGYAVCYCWGHAYAIYEWVSCQIRVEAEEIQMTPSEVTIKDGESRTIEFTLTASEFQMDNSTFEWTVEGAPTDRVSISNGVLTITDAEFDWGQLTVRAENENFWAQSVVYIEEAEKPKFDLKSWLIGYTLGLCGKPLPIASQKGEYEFCRYNGVQFPKLPAWDKKTYPYVAIGIIGLDFNLVTSKIPFYVDDNGEVRTGGAKDDSLVWGIKGGVSTLYWAENAVSFQYLGFKETLWCNRDILNDDGSVYLAASKPVPVYE